MPLIGFALAWLKSNVTGPAAAAMAIAASLAVIVPAALIWFNVYTNEVEARATQVCEAEHQLLEAKAENARLKVKADEAEAAESRARTARKQAELADARAELLSRELDQVTTAKQVVGIKACLPRDVGKALNR